MSDAPSNFTCVGFWHHNVKAGQVHDHSPKTLTASYHKLCVPVFTRRGDGRCVYDTISANHSDSYLEVHTGAPEPVLICEYHEQRWSVPGAAKSPLNSDGSKKEPDDG